MTQRYASIVLLAICVVGQACSKTDEPIAAKEWYASLSTHSHKPVDVGQRHHEHMKHSSGRHWMLEKSINFPKSPEEMILVEVTQYPDTVEPSAEQKKSADELVRESFAAAKRNGWFDFAKGLKDGFELMFADSEHYVKREFITDDKILDPDRPEFLMYYETSRGPKLAGYMYMVRTPEERGPQIGGPSTIWHYHIWPDPICLYRGMFSVAMLDTNAKCREGVVGQKSPEMIHVWFIEHPDGPYATGMKLSPEQVNELKKMSF